MTITEQPFIIEVVKQATQQQNDNNRTTVSFRSCQPNKTTTDRQ